MRPLSRRFVVLALLAGGLWGLLGLALAGQSLGQPVWGGVLASPLIGLAVSIASRRFQERSAGLRVALSLASLYVAAGLFGLVAGMVDAARPISGRIAGAVVLQTILGVWWGLTFLGWLPLLWPLAYLTHSILSRADRWE
jgi:hypothetical protein